MYLISLEEMILWNTACMLFGVLFGFAAVIIGFRRYHKDIKCTTTQELEDEKKYPQKL